MVAAGANVGNRPPAAHSLMKRPQHLQHSPEIALVTFPQSTGDPKATSSPAPTMTVLDKAFTGSIPSIYNRLLVPLIFEPYAVDMAIRVAPRNPQRILEVAAGTGVVTRHLAASTSAEIIATDLNQSMLDEAQQHATPRPVTWQQADAASLPFDDESFDVVACQFGVMFFPDRVAAYAEARRVLKPGGLFVFNVWNSLLENDFADAAGVAMTRVFPTDPSQFLERVPFGYHDWNVIASDLHAGGFRRAPQFHIVESRAVANSARIPAVAFVQGTPMRNEIASRDADRLEDVTDAAEAEITRRFGTGAVTGRIQATVVEVQR